MIAAGEELGKGEGDQRLPYVAAAVAAGGEDAPLVRGYAMGSLSMTCYGLGVEAERPVDGEGAAGVPEGVPADQSNI